MFDRIISLIGEENFAKIQKKHVLIIGVGGVGGYVFEGLIRSGIKNIDIIDGDIISISNINRQIIAKLNTVGQKKVDVLRNRGLEINKEADIKVNTIFINEENIPKLNLENYDYVVDCIDDLQAKVSLAKYAYMHNIKLIISTGTARKMDPTKLKITTLDKTSYDPLARKLRSSLRGYNLKNFICLASDEPPMDCKQDELGSFIFVPATAGLVIASYIIKEILT